MCYNGCRHFRMSGPPGEEYCEECNNAIDDCTCDQYPDCEMPKDECICDWCPDCDKHVDDCDCYKSLVSC